MDIAHQLKNSAGVQCKYVGCLWLPSNTATCCINIKFDGCVVWSQLCEYQRANFTTTFECGSSGVGSIYLITLNPSIYKMFLSMIK